jgi:hypothetical protein
MSSAIRKITTDKVSKEFGMNLARDVLIVADAASYAPCAHVLQLMILQ